MIVASRYRIKHLEHQFNIQVNNHYLTRDNSYKYLGVEIAQSLTWRDHVVTIAKKTSGGIGALRRVRHFIPRETLITMYSSLVLPYFDYCSTVWGSCGRGMCDRLQVLQNRAFYQFGDSWQYRNRSIVIRNAFLAIFVYRCYFRYFPFSGKNCTFNRKIQ